MRSGAWAGAAVFILFNCLLNTASGFCADPILACDSTLATGIGAVTFTDANGNPARITSVSHKAATSTAPAYCEIRGYRWPADLFIIALPDSWMGNYWQTGNGGAGGALGRITEGINRGYVAASGSGGYDMSQGAGLADFQAFYPPNDPVAKAKLSDYCFGSVHMTRLLAFEMIKAYYGADRKPAYSYYNSCSTGGRQGLIEAQRYPEDFDGLVIGAPAHYFSTGVQGRVWETQALTSDPWTSTGGSLAPKLPLLAARVMGKCDSRDGLVDGLIDDPRNCTFNPILDLPSCPEDSDRADCFTSRQREIIKKMYDGPPGLGYDSDYPRWAYGSEEMVPGMTLRSNWAGVNVPMSANPRSGWIQWVGLPMSGKGGPGWDWKTFDWTEGDPQLVAANTSAMCDAVDPDLSALKNKGGKIIHYVGWADNSTGAFSSQKYYDEVLSLMGSANTGSFYKLYMIPGMGHCGGAIGCGDVDWQMLIENWVEKGQAPGTVIGSRAGVGKPDSAPNYLAARTRPLCPYPQVARYLGTGSINEASSFACVEIIRADVAIKPGSLSLENATPSTFTASIELPRRGDWQAVSAVCEGALATSLTRSGRTYKATFNIGDLKNVNPAEQSVYAVTLFVKQQGVSLGRHAGVPVVLEGSHTAKIAGR